MNPILKGAIAFGTVAGTGGAGYAIYNAIQPTATPEKQKTTTYADAFKDTLLPISGSGHDQNWKDRLASLQNVDTTDKLVTGLKGLKTASGNDQWQQLRTWCANNINSPNKGKQDQEFKNIQSYCTYSNKEKLGANVIPDTDATGKWTAAHGKLSTINDLNEELTTIKNKQDGTGGEKLKAWCVSKYSEPYKGETNSTFMLAKKVCVSS